MGASEEEYRRAAPHNSFIHVDQFKGPQQLAEHLIAAVREDFERKVGRSQCVHTPFTHRSHTLGEHLFQKLCHRESRVAQRHVGPFREVACDRPGTVE